MADLSRREFLHAVAASTVGAVVFTGCQPRPSEGLTESRVLQAEDTLSAYENWYATTCRECPAGCGLIVRVIEGRAKKAEGNPDHPVNLGKLCARGQAVVQAEYHPDRLAGPQARTGPRGSAAFARHWLGPGPRPARQSHPRSPDSRPDAPLGADHAAAAWPTRHDRRPFLHFARRRAGSASTPSARRRCGRRCSASTAAPSCPTSTSNTRPGVVLRRRLSRDMVVASAVQSSVRTVPPGSPPRGRAGTWWPSSRGFRSPPPTPTSGCRHGPAQRGCWRRASRRPVTNDGGAVTPEQAEVTTGVPATRVRAIAARFAAAQRPLAIGGGVVGAQTNGTDALTAILQLNLLASSQA